MKNVGPIGVFDSGYGGLTVLSSFIEKMPEYDFLYLGDNARAPYGTRSFDVVYKYTLQAVNALFDNGCSLVILACNTASAKALRTIQQNDLPKMDPEKRVLGVIRPTTELISSLSKSNRVGVLATEGTVKSNSYEIEIKKFSPETKVYQHACSMWVPLIENGVHFTKPGKKFIVKDVKALLKMSSKIDTILLACTHYPVLQDYIQSMVEDDVQVISQGEIVANSLIDYLKRHPQMDQQLLKNGKVEYLTSGDTNEFDLKAKELVGLKVASKRIEF